MVCRKCGKETPDGSVCCCWCRAEQIPKKKRRRKRQNGTGSVYKDCGNKEKPWVARRAGIEDDDGTIVRPLIGRYKTEAEAEKALALDTITPVSEYAGITLDGLFKLWKKTRAYTDIAKQTQDNYDAAFAYLKDFHGLKFADLRTAHFQKAIDAAEAKGKSRSTMEKIKALCTILSNYAVSQDVILKSYAVTLRLPRAKKKVIPTFTETEIAKLFKNTDKPLVDTVLILIYTGMRIRELLNLTKFSVNLEQWLIVGGSKTEAGTDRTIPIHPKIQPLIRARYDTAENYLIEYDKPIGNKKKGSDKTVRTRYNYEHYCDLYYATLSEIGIRRLTPHKARHTFFTRLSERCKDRKGMALVGGHTDPAFTEKTYDQPDIDRLRRVIGTL